MSHIKDFKKIEKNGAFQDINVCDRSNSKHKDPIPKIIDYNILQK